MEEKQSLLYKEQNFHRNANKFAGNDDDGQELSSDGSEEWWDYSGSSCSSCCDYHSRSSYEWEAEINENGELFYIESDANGFFEEPAKDEYPKPDASLDEKAPKENNIKGGRLINWMRRRDSKKQQSKPEVNPAKNQTDKVKPKNGEEYKEVALRIDSVGQGASLCEKLLGLSLDSSDENKAVVASIRPDGPAKYSKSIAVGDVLSKINNYNVVPQNVENILGSINFPNEVFLKIQKTERCETPKRHQSNLVKILLERNEGLDSILLEHPVGIAVVDMESQNLNKDDVIYSYPEKCVLSLCRGAFVTLFHLLGQIHPNDECQSSSILMKKQRTHVVYKSENNFLLLIAIPQSICTLEEATFKVNDLLRNLLFCHQTLKRCFETTKKSDLDHFFSLYFSFLLTNDVSAIASRFTENMPLEVAQRQLFEDIVPFVKWLPLPREAQIQVDDALNELEANDIDHEEANILESQRLFNMIGSCLFHKDYLLASHLPKEDLLDIYSFYRQNYLIELFRTEPVKSLIVWKEVFPQSVNRGLATRKPAALPTGKWFLLIIGQGFDSLALLLEIGNCCAKTDENSGPSIPYVEEAEDTLRHIRKLGITSLASQWIENNKRFKTTTPEEVFAKKGNRRKENLLGFVKPFDGAPKSPGLNVSSGSSKSSDTNASKKLRSVQPDVSEDSMSQTASNVSEVSDENVPILGRRGERRRPSVDQTSDSDSSDSDWDSSRDSNIRESICSGGVDNFYLGDVGDVIPAKLTTGPDYLLFHYVQLDGNEGVLLNAPSSVGRSTPKMAEILENFKRCALIIHSTLENSVKFKKNSQDGGKCFINKSLVAVKEHGVLFECAAAESDGHKKPLTLTYWIVGRLFFTPQPREVYVCYHDEAPQNLVEIAFRLGLCSAG